MVEHSLKTVATVDGVEVQARASGPGVAQACSFRCARCGAGLAATPPARVRTALQLDAWFASHGWDSTSGRPVCGACKGAPPAPAAPVVEAAPAPPVGETLAGALETAEKATGLRGRFVASPLGSVVSVTWTSAEGSRGDLEREALRAAVRALVAAGFQAETIPGMSFVRVMMSPADLIGADEPGVDHEHGRDDGATFAMAAE